MLSMLDIYKKYSSADNNLEVFYAATDIRKGLATQNILNSVSLWHILDINTGKNFLNAHPSDVLRKIVPLVVNHRISYILPKHLHNLHHKPDGALQKATDKFLCP